MESVAPRLSVILCTYNRCNLVLSALAALRRQTLSYPLFEVIVVDNGSTDGTFNAVQMYVNAGSLQPRKAEDSWRVRCLSEPQRGLAYARNTGVRAASGEIAVFLDDDTLPEPHLLEHLLTSYDETQADAIGGRVHLRWEAPRPHWLSDDLLDQLGYFAPESERIQLPETMNFKSNNFSVRIEALHAVGDFSPSFSTVPHVQHAPTSMAIDDLCLRLRQAGYTLWYEPDATVVHRVSKVRLQQPYFTGRAYWQGRAEVCIQYAVRADVSRPLSSTSISVTRTDVIHQSLHGSESLLQQGKNIAHMVLVEQGLLMLANKPTHERLRLAMEQAYMWGRFQQQLRFLEHAPQELQTPIVLLVAPTTMDASVKLLAQALAEQQVSCMLSTNIPLSWLWQHRTYDEKTTAVLHIYRPGAFEITHWQRQRMRFSVWLARRLGIAIVSTDTGGWWQNVQHMRYSAHRTFERFCFQYSKIVFAFTRQPDQLYPDKSLRRRVRCLPHPGYRGYFTSAMPRAIAQKQLGLLPYKGCVYLCFAHLHTEQEIIHLLHAFTEVESMQKMRQHMPGTEPRQLLLVGMPKDKPSSTRILEQAAISNTIHLFMEPASEASYPLYFGAAHALVMPYLAVQTAGMTEMAFIALSHERFAILPDLPRFRGMLPPHMSTLYDPSSRTSLVQALCKAEAHDYPLKQRDISKLDAESSWREYARRVAETYRQLQQD